MVVKGTCPDRSCIKQLECITLATSLFLASLVPPMLGMSQAKLAPHWMVLAVAICRCWPKPSLRSNCTPRYLIFVFHTPSCSPKSIFGYWKDLLSMTSKSLVFLGAIFSPLLSNQRFVRHKVSFMRRKSSYMTFHTRGPFRGPRGAPYVNAN